MIYNTQKYNSLKDFITQSTNSRVMDYSLPMQTCKGVSQDNSINTSCFYCNFCAFGQISKEYKNKIQEILTNYKVETFFKGIPIKVPNAYFYDGDVNKKNLEFFTSIEETKRIQLWATCILSNCTLNNVVSCIELPSPAQDYDRDGRIDIGIKENNNFLFIETKTTLKSAMADERFVEQHAKYMPAIEEYTKSNKVNYLLCILIGGKETDLFPTNTSYCTGIIGDLTERFYNLISSNNCRIPFISSTALWLLSLYYLLHPEFSINEFLIKLFSEENCYGLVSAGKIIYSPLRKKFEILNINLP